MIFLEGLLRKGSGA